MPCYYHWKWNGRLMATSHNPAYDRAYDLHMIAYDTHMIPYDCIWFCIWLDIWLTYDFWGLHMMGIWYDIWWHMINHMSSYVKPSYAIICLMIIWPIKCHIIWPIICLLSRHMINHMHNHMTDHMSDDHMSYHMSDQMSDHMCNHMS